MQNATPWIQETPISADDVKVLIHENIEDFEVQSISLLGEGWDNTSWLVNGEWSFRIPKHAEAGDLIRNEINILPHLSDLGVLFPKPEWIVRKPKNYHYPFYGHRYLIGTPADRSNLDDKDRIALAEPLAKFLKKLHSFPIEKAKRLGVQYDQLDRTGIKKRYRITQERLQYLSAHQLIKEADFYLHYFEPYLDLIPPERWVLAHGDVYARHLLLNQEKELRAVIDWGDCEILHPAIDLRIVYSFFPPASHPQFWQVYGVVDEITQIIAKLCGVYSAVALVWYGHQVGDRSLLEEGLKGLVFIKES
jgi:aminoglycoside phosphotransferase (APT) family kinase protein